MARKARSFKERRSARPIRQPYALVMIVCEGAKTEPAYFKGLVDDLKLSTANIVVYGEECGSSPRTLVRFAIERYKENRAFDRVFCVFDRDAHPDFDAAVDQCSAQRKKSNGDPIFVAITSDPCFEFWLLLHFEETFKPFARTDTKSVGDQAVAELKRYLPKYAKGGATYGEVKQFTDVAITRAGFGRKQGIESPSTSMDLAVEYLRAIKRS